LLAAGYGSGRVGRARRRPKPFKPPKPVCACEHSFAHHAADGTCKHIETLTDTRDVPITDSKGKTIYRPSGYVETNEQTVVVAQVPCTCQRYVGPQPMPEYFAPEIGG
jgi:hypothetical protein